MIDRPDNILRGCSVLPAMQSAKPMTGRPPKTTGAAPTKSKDKATGNRFVELNSFVDCSMADLSRAELATWLVLWRDTRNGTVRTSGTDIARRIGTSRRAVTDALAGLRKRGLLTQVYRGGLNRGVSVHRVNPRSVEIASPGNRSGD